jgi:hypothetical protein
MDKLSMAMGITLLNKATLFTMTLAQVVGESKSTTWSIVEWDVSQKIESKERNETKRCVWISCNPW